MMTDRLTVKVNYILDVQNKGKFNFDNSIQTLRIRPKTPNIWGKYAKIRKEYLFFIFEHISLLEKKGK